MKHSTTSIERKGISPIPLRGTTLPLGGYSEPTASTSQWDVRATSHNTSRVATAPIGKGKPTFTEGSSAPSPSVSTVQSTRRPSGGTPVAGSRGEPQSAPPAYRPHVLQKLQSIFQSNVFDTTGPNEDVLKLLLASCKAMIEAVVWQSQQVDQVNQRLPVVDHALSQFDAMESVVERFEECSKKVSFLWAAQGLGDLSFDKLGPSAVQATVAPSTSGRGMDRVVRSAKTADDLLRQLEASSPAPSAVLSPSRTLRLDTPPPLEAPPARVQPRRQPAAQPQSAGSETGPQVASSGMGIGESVQSAMAVEDVLRKSLETTVLMDQHIKSLNHQREVQHTNERFTAIEDSMETIYRHVLKVEAQTVALEQKVEVIREEGRQHDHRLTAALETFDVSAKRLVDNQSKLQGDHKHFQQLLQDTRTTVDSIGKQTKLLVEQSKSIVAELTDLRTSRPSVKDVKGLIAQHASSSSTASTPTAASGLPAAPGSKVSSGAGKASQPPRREVEASSPGRGTGVGAEEEPPSPSKFYRVKHDVDALYLVLDLPQPAVRQWFENLSGARDSVAPSESVSPQKSKPSKAAAAGEGLKIVHAALPFRTMLTATAKLADTLEAVKAQQEAAEKRQPPAPPLLGLELSDSEEGARVVRVFKGLPADRSGIQEGDLIVAVNGAATPNREAFARATQSLGSFVPLSSTSHHNTSQSSAAGARSSKKERGLPMHVMRRGKLVELTLIV
jgi:hypothetical protein